MKTSLKMVTAAAFFSSVAFGGAMAQSQNEPGNMEPDTGTYYQGAERTMSDGGGTLNAPLVVQPEQVAGGESNYYPGLERNPGVDRMSTGSIAGGTQDDTLSGGEGEYYQGATVNSDAR